MYCSICLVLSYYIPILKSIHYHPPAIFFFSGAQLCLNSITSRPAVDYSLFRGLIVPGTQSRGRAHITFYVNSRVVFSRTVLMASHSCEAIPVTVR